ncbi:glycosyltransferase family 4 protein [Clostridium amazonitimonense]|uniref:glycosyltransferase family 4 protein n=1 Tax=Clostridium amazonitimonense TaxID=1499689 RepID=UPI000509C4E9|nr:glycosyltransferase family 1 protein [Clostridium amazonitimonense]
MIYINGSILDEKPAGLGIYTKNVVQNLGEMDKDLVLFCPIEVKGIKTEIITEKVKTIHKKKGGLMRFLWTQFVLPFKVKRGSILYHPFQYLSVFSGTKQIITLHDLIPVQYPAIAKHQYYYYKWVMPILLKRAYKIVCISENTKEDILKNYKVDKDKITVIYNGYEEKQFNEDNNHKEILEKYKIDYDYMIMVGASYRHKNLHSAIKAYGKVRDQLNSKLVIIGKDSPYIKELKELTKSLDLEDSVKFLGYVKDEDLPTLYANSTCFVYPTLYEGFGLPILEAMACKTPVICSNNSSLPEVAGDAALYFNPESEEEIAKAMVEINKDQNLREELLNKSKENVKRFSWKYTAEAVYKLMK